MPPPPDSAAGSEPPVPPVLPSWATLVRAANPGPMTLGGTNTYLLRASGQDAAVVVDPGPLLDAHLEAVAALGPVQVVLLTHRHPDHAGGATRFAEIAGGVPVLAADPVGVRTQVPGALPLPADGELIDAGGLRVRVLATPGHTGDSVCFAVDGDEPAVLTGDTVLGRGTTVLAPPDGSLADYLASLRRLARFGAVRLLPGHGPVRPDLAAVATEYLAHRAHRLDQVRAAVAGGARTPREVVEIVYVDVDPALWPAAEWSVRVQLDYLGVPRSG